MFTTNMTEQVNKIVTELLKNHTLSDAIEILEKEIAKMNEQFNVFGYTSDDLRLMKTKKEALKSLKNE